MPSPPFRALDAAALERLYGAPARPSLAKVADRLTPAYRLWLERAPFVAIASSGSRPSTLADEHGAFDERATDTGAADCSPRGDAPGRLLSVLDERTIAIPDRRGNRRTDTLRNLVANPAIGLLFLIPGVQELLRVNGRAIVTDDAGLLGRLELDGARPTTAIVVSVEAVYFQCARALMRSALWDPASCATPGEVPSAGEMIRSVDAGFDARGYDAALRARQRKTL